MTFLLALAVFLCGVAAAAPAAVLCVLRSEVGIHLIAMAQKPKGKPPKRKPPKNVKKVKETFTDWKATS